MGKNIAITILVLAMLTGTSTFTGIGAQYVRESDTVFSSSSYVENRGYDLLIISPSEFKDALQPLVVHKDSHGVQTMLVTLDDIYNSKYFPVQGRDDAEKVKYFIKDSIENWGIKYVLLVGGRKPGIPEKWLMPVRYSHIVDNVEIPENKFLSDLYFADIYDSSGHFSSWDTNNNGIFGEWYSNKTAGDTADLYPDVYVGRLPCRNEFEVKIMVNKIIAYESGTYGQPWFNRIVVVGGDTYTSNDYYEGEVTNQKIIDEMPGFEPVKLWASDGSLKNWRDVVGAINQGCGFLNFEGHGSPTTWATHPPHDENTWIYGLQIFQMPLLSNGNMLPVCVVGGCHNSLFNVSVFHSTWTFGLPVPECWSWWLTRDVKGGSIATIGCTGLGYGKEDKRGPVKEGGGDLLDTLFFKEYGMDGVHILGEAWGKAIEAYLDRFPIDWSQWAFNDTALDAKTVQEWILFGDPSLQIGGYS